MQNLSHSASFHSLEKYAPPNAGTKQLGRANARFAITQEDSAVKFSVKASVEIAGKFDKWDASLTFTSPDVTTGVLDIKAQAASVDTGSGMKDGKLKGKDFFDAQHDPLITFHSTKVVPTGPNTFDIPGTFTIRGVSKSETLSLTVSGRAQAQARSRG
ncbi:YceI family protein [Edaphobacter modestus]|uniref:YceI family protein n=1 Tax=Edaphobacter modestus TaxID=388466 RepID=UPI00102B93D9|nr:YceI family protein [Edaphobacter modestus]